jgi:hypothetical protein
MTRTFVPLALLALAVLGPASPGADPAPVPRSGDGLQVAVDSKTGRLTAPTPDQRAKLAAALARAIDHRTEGLEVRRGPHGMRLVDLQGRFQNVEVAVRGTDGAVHLRCIDSLDELDSLFENEER